MAKSIFGTLQVQWKRFAIHQSDQKRWVIYSHQGYTESSLCSLFNYSSSANLFTFLALKQRAKIEVKPLLDFKHMTNSSVAMLISTPIYYEL